MRGFFHTQTANRLCPISLSESALPHTGHSKLGYNKKTHRMTKGQTVRYGGR